MVRHLTLHSLTISLIAFALLGCGKNSGTPQPTPQQPSGEARTNPPQNQTESPAPSSGDDKLYSASTQNRWRARIVWDQEPKFSSETLLDITGSVYFRSVDNKSLQSVNNVKLVADMPEHGHGTGRFVPKIKAENGEINHFTFSNLIFTMTGKWRIRIAAELNGAADIWETQFEVKE